MTMFPPPKTSPGTQTVGNIDARHSDEEISEYLLYMPSVAQDRGEGNRPLLVFLHGRGEAARNKQQTKQGIEAVKKYGTPPAQVDRAGWQLPFVIVSPQLPLWTSRWHEDRHRDRMASLLEHLIEEYRIDQRSVFATGFSIGGVGAMSMSLRTGVPVAAIAAVDSYDPEPRWIRRNIATASAAAIPVRSDQGATNAQALPLIESVNPRALVIVRAGGHTEVCEHAYAVNTSAPGIEDLYSWLLRPRVAGDLGELAANFASRVAFGLQLHMLQAFAKPDVVLHSFTKERTKGYDGVLQHFERSRGTLRGLQPLATDGPFVYVGIGIDNTSWGLVLRFDTDRIAEIWMEDYCTEPSGVIKRYARQTNSDPAAGI